VPQAGLRVKLNVGLVGLEEIGRLPGRLVLDLDRRLPHGRAAELQ
jgi:hypothetical protein